MRGLEPWYVRAVPGSASAEPLVQSGLIGEAVEDGPALVFVADEEMRYVAVNRHACSVLGYTREELLRLRVTDVAVEPDAPSMYEDLLRTRRGRGATSLRRRDGTELRFDFRAGETRLGGLTYYVAVGFVDEAPF